MSDTAPPLRPAMSGRVVVADGAMGTMLQASAAAPDDFGGHEGCNEILKETRPDIVRSGHDGCLADGERAGLAQDLDDALTRRPVLEIVNDVLPDGMKTVGERFASGQMQLPFVLQSAEAKYFSV
jgi:cobalamin-dependent methionine synthase I